MASTALPPITMRIRVRSTAILVPFPRARAARSGAPGTAPRRASAHSPAPAADTTSRAAPGASHVELPASTPHGQGPSQAAAALALTPPGLGPPIRPGSLAGFGLELVALLFDRGAERAGAVALQAFGERVDVDSGVGNGGDGPLRRRVVRVEALVEGAMIGEGEQRLFRDGVDGAGGSKAAQVVGVGKVRVLGRGGWPPDPVPAGARLG